MNFPWHVAAISAGMLAGCAASHQRTHPAATNSTTQQATTPSMATTAPPAPVAPLGLRVASRNAKLLTMAWDQTALGQVVEFVLTARRARSNDAFTRIATVSYEETHCSIGGLSTDIDYEVRIEALDFYGRTSAPSASVVVSDGIKQPAVVQATRVSNDQAVVSWIDECDCEEGYVVEKSTDRRTWTHAMTVPADKEVAIIDHLAPQEGYDFRVYAKPFGLGAPGMPVLSDYGGQARKEMLPSAPVLEIESVTPATDTAPATAVLRWRAGTTDHDRYELESSPPKRKNFAYYDDDANDGKDGAIDKSAATFTIHLRDPAEPMMFRLRAVKDGVYSIYSNSVTVNDDHKAK